MVFKIEGIRWIPAIGLSVFMLSLGLCAGIGIGESRGIRAMQREACKQGFADYDADENGDSQFVWAVPFGEVK